MRSKDGRIFNKPGRLISPDEELVLVQAQRFVSRGGDKLQGALENFDVKAKNKVCLDIGASTGGFTDCLLQNGAVKVYSVDVAYGKLDWKLRNDARVINMEKRNVRSLRKEDFQESIDLSCIDISFSSCRKAVLKAKEILASDGRLLLLFKPQFEVEGKHLEKGILRDKEILEKSAEDFVEFIKSEGMEVIGRKESAVKGRKGNQEYFFYLKNRSSG